MLLKMKLWINQGEDNKKVLIDYMVINTDKLVAYESKGKYFTFALDHHNGIYNFELPNSELALTLSCAMTRALTEGSHQKGGFYIIQVLDIGI